MDWDKIINAYRTAVKKQAQTEAEYKHQRAVFIATNRAEDAKLTQSAAETLADADDDLHQLRVARLGYDAEVEAFKAKLQWCRAKSDALRSEKVDERESNKIYAENAA